MSRPNLPAAARMMERLDALALHTDEPGKLTRLYLSNAHKSAIGAVMGWMREAGLSPALDAVGNVHARYEGRMPGLPALIIASHIDTVRDGGKYDDNLGVLAGLAVVEELARNGERLPFAIEIIAFGDEEGVRFPVTLSGSKAVAGRFDLAALDARDEDGISLREALTRFGLDPAGIPAIARQKVFSSEVETTGRLQSIRPSSREENASKQEDGAAHRSTMIESRSKEAVLAYLELHIEQGPVLEAANEPLGVVTAIASIARLTVSLKGMAGHAGTVPMAYRQDALAAAVMMIYAAETIAKDNDGLLATVGRIDAKPGAVNVIPGDVSFTLDIRSPNDEQRREGVNRIVGACQAIAAERLIGIEISAGYEEEASHCHPAIQNGLAAAIQSLGHTPLSLLSGAGHDAASFEALCPMGMLFVRCKGGISHNPAESITPEDADIALAAMLAFVRGFDPGSLGSGPHG